MIKHVTNKIIIIPVINKGKYKIYKIQTVFKLLYSSKNEIKGSPNIRVKAKRTS